MDEPIDLKWAAMDEGSRWETVFLPRRHHSGKVAQVELDRGGEDVAGVQSRLHVPLGYPVALHVHTGPAWGRRDGLQKNTTKYGT